MTDKVYSRKKLFKYSLGSIAKMIYAVAISITILFLMQMAFFQNIEIYSKRTNETYYEVKNISKHDYIAPDTPLGRKTEYSWIQQEVISPGNYLSFYTVHQFVEVYFDDELMYRTTLENENKVGKSPGSNWVIIPLYEEDEGKRIRINSIPVYEQVGTRLLEIHIGTKYRIYAEQIKKDLLQIIISCSTILIGLLFMAISIYHIYSRKGDSNLVYLGLFSFGIGTWKLLDIRSAPLIFANNPAVLSYISIGMLTLSVAPWILSINRLFLKKYYRFIELVSIFFSLITLIIIGAQVMGIADFRETLWITHIIIGLSVLTIIGVSIKEGYSEKHTKTPSLRLKICLVLFGIAAIADVIWYYIQGNSSQIIYIFIAFLIYVINMGYISIKSINDRACIDTHTSLLNKSKCNEILDQERNIKDPVAIIMFDLNGLKQVNDEQGHEVGDALIRAFAEIIKNKVDKLDFLGRYGGDEFLAVIRKANSEKVKHLLESIEEEVIAYNKDQSVFTLSYASGYALSENHPKISLRELLEKADANMYTNKRSYKDSIEVDKSKSHDDRL